jgi:A/G-specific adenine glycosylase
VNVLEFQEIIWQKGHELYRDMPWRQDTRPYYVLVSEIMLQQTQVDRVTAKFQQFIVAFPTVQALAEASLADVLTQWSGLGYNRRAKFLHETAKKLVAEYSGKFPQTLAELTSLPGVGVNTAGAILAYSFNQPVVFIETNIRTVYFHHFFSDQQMVDDKQLRELVEQTLDHEHPREWYWALMDYGAELKHRGLGRIDQSRHYKKQAPLRGSLREVRGMILKSLTAGDLSADELAATLPTDDRLARALAALIQEGLVATTDGRLHLTR